MENQTNELILNLQLKGDNTFTETSLENYLKHELDNITKDKF